MKIVYLTWGETPRAHGVFGSQVIGQFAETKKISPNHEFHFVSGVPLIHSGLLREKLSYIKELRLVKERLGDINFHWLPIFAIQSAFNSSKRTFWLMHSFAHRWLRRLFERLQPDVVHCRSYHAAWAALSVRKKYDLKYRIVFDGRGLWPEEVALKKNWKSFSKDYLYLKGIEKRLLSECEVSISVSETMHKHYESLGSRNDRVVYLSADTASLAIARAKDRPEGPVRFCYVGALSDDTWHKPKMLLDLFKHLRKLFPDIKITIVTTSSHEKLRELFEEFKSEVVLKSTKTKFELRDLLKDQDFGLMTYFEPASDREVLLGKMVLAVKTAEYLASGLPMICSNYCGGAAAIIENNGLGVVYDPKRVCEINLESLMALLDSNVSARCQEFAARNFDYQVNAKKYLDIYEELSF